MTLLALTVSGQATANAAGNATILLGPDTQNEVWTVKRVTISNTSVATMQVTAQMYRNYVGATNFIGGTYAAQSDTDSNVLQEFRGSENLVVVYSNADPNSLCTVSVFGDRELKGALIY